jgi:hypothetical protein
MSTIRTFCLAGVLTAAACAGTSDLSSGEEALKAAAAADAVATADADQAPPQVCTVGVADPRACDPAQTKKTTICHIPPGNPANAHTLCVGTPSVPAHLAHGDHLGSCCDAIGDGGATIPPTTPPPAAGDGGTTTTAPGSPIG